jgi:hypothetical protein
LVAEVQVAQPPLLTMANTTVVLVVLVAINTMLLLLLRHRHTQLRLELVQMAHQTQVRLVITLFSRL